MCVPSLLSDVRTEQMCRPAVPSCLMSSRAWGGGNRYVESIREFDGLMDLKQLLAKSQ